MSFELEREVAESNYGPTASDDPFLPGHRRQLTHERTGTGWIFWEGDSNWYQEDQAVFVAYTVLFK